MRGNFHALLDRAGASLTALCVLVLAAKLSSASEFGVFALLMATAVAVQTAYRAVPGSWLLLSASMDTDFQPPKAARTLAIWFGIGGGALVCAVGLVVQSDPYLAFGVACQCVAGVLADARKLTAYGEGRPGVPAVLSTSTLASFCGLALAWWEFDLPLGPAVPVFLFALSTTIPTLVVQAPWHSSAPLKVKDYVRDHKVDVAGQSATAGIQASAQLLVPLLLQVVVGPAAVGAIRGAQSLASVPGQIPVGLQPILLARTAIRQRDSLPQRRQVARWFCAVSLVFTAALVGALSVPWPIWVALLGESADGVRAALPGVLVSTWATSCLLAVEAVFRIRLLMGRFAFLRLLTLLMVAAGALVGQHFGGISGAAWGLASANSFMLVLSVLGVSLRGRGKRSA